MARIITSAIKDSLVYLPESKSTANINSLYTTYKLPIGIINSRTLYFPENSRIILLLKKFFNIIDKEL